MSENAAVAEVLSGVREQYIVNFGPMLETDSAQEFVAAMTQAIDVLEA
jgi:hypothetical protein